MITERASAESLGRSVSCKLYSAFGRAARSVGSSSFANSRISKSSNMASASAISRTKPW